MNDDERTRIGREVLRLRRCHQYLVDELAGSGEPCREVDVHWDLVGRALRWRVFLDDVLEPDLDIEVLHDMIVVRGAHDPQGPPRRQALVPVPPPFSVRRRTIRFVSGVLEIRIERAS